MDDPGMDGRLDDSGEGTLERPQRRQQPMPPPRIDSYRYTQQQQQHHRRLGSGQEGGASRSGSNSEMYDRLEEEGARGGAGGAGGDNSLVISGSEDSDAFSSMDRRNGGPAERLVKPSQIKSKKRQQGKTVANIIVSAINVSVQWCVPSVHTCLLSPACLFFFFVLCRSLPALNPQTS